MRLAISIKNLFFKYRNENVLEEINATICEGEYIALIGPNGGGKSTLLKLILGLLTPTQGEVLIFGKPPFKQRKLLGYMPQYVNFKLELPLLVKEVILQGRLERFKFRYTPNDFKALYEISQKLKIENLLDKKISTLSGGLRQRVLLARALIANPKILLLDEPTASVDMKAQREIYALLKTLPITKLVVSHDINLLLEGVDRVFYVNKRLVIHESLDIKISSPREGHFCQVELFEELKRSKNDRSS
ncbi:MAG: metal ABC transporter ATP-binding protein [Epsilonproteobacteria bacterium]|nr:metal ABC transporter ATP-binding protein [Campylobacterota bacterium]